MSAPTHSPGRDSHSPGGDCAGGSRADSPHDKCSPEAHGHGHDHGHGERHGHSHGHGHNHCQHHHHSSFGGERTQLTFAIAAAVLLLAGWLARWLLSTGLPLGDWLIGAAFFFGGFFAAIDAVTGLWARRFQIDFLMVLAALGAAYIGHASEGALLLVLFSLGHAAEHYAMGRAKRSIEALAQLRPTAATVLDERTGQTHEVAIEQLQIGDVVIVRPDSRIAADGVVIFGQSSVDQSTVTGESMPADKVPVPQFDPHSESWQTLPPEHKLFAGTINGGGAMRLRVTRTAEEMTLARVIRMVTDAKTLRSPTQRLTASFERYFVPAVLALVGLLLMAFLVLDEPFSRSLYRAIAVLVAASPCALALATPSAVLSAVARGGRDGVLFKGGGPLEQLGGVEVIAFDKTGTLTRGKPEVVDVIAAPGHSEAEVLWLAATVERLSDHPLASAVVRAAEATAAPAQVGGSISLLSGGDGEATTAHGSAENIQRLSGYGIRADVQGQSIWIGSARLFSEKMHDAADGDFLAIPDWLIQVDQSLQARGRTTMIVRRGDAFLGAIGLMDVARSSARPLANALRQIGITQLLMLSGDNQQAAQAIGDEIGIDQVLGGLSPEAKLEAIQRIAEQRPVAMIGDGVNDAPALAVATVSIAMGAAGSDVALETADVALMADDLSKLPFAVSLSRQASKIIRQNLWISLGMIAILVPSALLGLHLAVAVVFHEGSTLLVVANALRLLSFRPAEPKHPMKS